MGSQPDAGKERILREKFEVVPIYFADSDNGGDLYRIDQEKDDWFGLDVVIICSNYYFLGGRVRDGKDDDDDFLLGLIPGELIENMVPVAKYVAWLGKNYCSNPSLKGFEHANSDWINNGVDPYGWELSWEEMEREANRMKEFISINANLYDEMKFLLDLEQTLKNTTAQQDGPTLLDFQNKVELKRQEVKNLKEVSLWNMTHDCVAIFLAKSLFTIFRRIKHVFGVPQLKADAETKDSDHHISPSSSIFSKHNLLDAPPETLGAADLALHYANVVIKIEKFVASPLLCYGIRYKLELYNMLPSSMKDELSERLPCIERATSSLEDLAAESKEAIAGTLEWLAPLAHNTTKWQSKRSFQKKASVSRTHVLMVHTLYFANQRKTEATITELIVGLQYIWKYERQRHRIPKPKALLALEAASLEAKTKPKSVIAT